MVVTKSVYIYRKCLNMFTTFKVLAEKAFEILQDFIFMILQNSCFTFMRASFFTLSSRVQLSSHYKSSMFMLRDSPLFLQCLSAMLSFKEESSQLLKHICMIHKTTQAPYVSLQDYDWQNCLDLFTGSYTSLTLVAKIELLPRDHGIIKSKSNRLPEVTYPNFPFHYGCLCLILKHPDRWATGPCLAHSPTRSIALSLKVSFSY